MQKMNYSLIVTDFDGTLLKSDGTISQRTKDAINRYMAKGGKFAISTGRMPAAILPHIKELGLDGVVSCAQGSIPNVRNRLLVLGAFTLHQEFNDFHQVSGVVVFNNCCPRYLGGTGVITKIRGLFSHFVFPPEI
ncbi:MAG: HAD-IIB family hydrolase [Clostridia bacterium]|nr:HAD-IIB family hydrolase [Clostridia bacterium]